MRNIMALNIGSIEPTVRWLVLHKVTPIEKQSTDTNDGKAVRVEFTISEHGSNRSTVDGWFEAILTPYLLGRVAETDSSYPMGDVRVELTLDWNGDTQPPYFDPIAHISKIEIEPGNFVEPFPHTT